MRPVRHTHRNAAARTALAGIPVAVVGSIALSLSATPAHADSRYAQAGGPVMQGLRSLAPAPSPAVAPKTLQAAAVRQAQTPPPSYTVQAGDTVSAIAARYGLRTPDVLALNNLSWRSVIHPGQVLSLGGTPAAPSSAPSAGGYTVQAGDTISAIARRHGLSTNAVLSANGLSWSSIIYPGQVLAIPGATTSGAAPQAPAPAPAPAPSPAPSGGGYTVVAGDTISAIAQRHGVTTDAVLGANGLNRSSIIYPGQTLTIPLAAVAASAPAVPGLDAEQVANAQLIVRIGRELGVPDRGIAIALGTAMQESWIRNLDWGDRDSLGLFQQRPSTGWGTEAEVRDAARSIRAFYGGASDPNGTRTRGLLDIPGWESMSFAEAAQAVQISAYPERYAQWEASAHAWLAALG